MPKFRPQVAAQLSHLEHVPIESIVDFQKSLKDLTTDNYNRLKLSIMEHGVIAPWFVYDNADAWVIDKYGDDALPCADGHQRLRLFMNEQWYMPVPIVRISAENEQDAKMKLLVITSQMGRITAEGFSEFTFDLDEAAVGERVWFDAFTFQIDDETLEDESEDDEPVEISDDDVDESIVDQLQKKWQTEEGQLWLLPSVRSEGKYHKVYIGDCRDAESVAAMFGDEKATCYLTDPPYGVSLKEKTEMLNRRSDIAGTQRLSGEIAADDMSAEELSESLWLPAFQLAHEVCHDRMMGFCFSAQGGTKEALTIYALEDAGFDVRHQLVWVKHNHAISPGYVSYKHEPISMFWKKGNPAEWRGEFTMSVLNHDRITVSKDHPTKKPVELVVELLSKVVTKGAIVFDSFLGSGSTMVAAENVGALCYGTEVDPKFGALIIERYCNAFDVAPKQSG